MAVANLPMRSQELASGLMLKREKEAVLQNSRANNS